MRKQRRSVIKKEFRLLVASDGSAQAKHAVATAVHFPWPAQTRVRAVIARRTRAEYRQSILLAALDRSAEFAVRAAQRVLTQRWPDADVVVVDKTPIDGVLHEARRFGAAVIVLGWRGHGVMQRLLMGSVSRGVVRGARCAVLVVRRRSSDVHKIVIGVDGSPHARRAVALVARLTPPQRGEITLFTAVEELALPAYALSPSAVRGTVGAEVRRLNLQRITAARKELDRAAARLKRRGWRVRVVMTTGAPLRDLLAAVATARAHAVVVGARGVSGVRRLLLGSVSEGVLNRCPVPVLVVR